MHTFFHLQKADLHEMVKFHVERRDENHLQDNHFVSSLYDFQFTELYHDDAISPKGESILQHALYVKQADEKTTGSKSKSQESLPY